jgi:hypothetical protein
VAAPTGGPDRVNAALAAVELTDLETARRSCGRATASRRAAIGMLPGVKMSLQRSSDWLVSCVPFGLDTMILSCPTMSPRTSWTKWHELSSRL